MLEDFASYRCVLSIAKANVEVNFAVHFIRARSASILNCCSGKFPLYMLEMGEAEYG